MTYHDIHALDRPVQEDVEAILNLWVEFGDEEFVDDKPCSVGVPPDSIEEGVDDALFRTRDLAHADQVIAIGECGLDRSIKVSWDDQLRVFEDQISLSELLCKPLIVHCVRGHAEVLMLHRELSPEQPWVVHAYNKGGDTLDRIMEAGMFVSFDAGIMDPESPALEALRSVPSDRFFLESGEQTEYDIKAIYQRAADIRGVPVEEMAADISRSFAAVFGQ